MRTEYMVQNFRLGSYATGNYFGKCDICAEEFIGDKRARSCLPCALKAVEALQAENANLLDILKRLMSEFDEPDEYMTVFQEAQVALEEKS
jgi:hypothetical protein